MRALSTAARYAIAAAWVGAAYVLKATVPDEYLGFSIPYPIAILLSAMIGGAGPGVFATLLATALVAPHLWSVNRLPPLAQAVRITVFALQGFGICLITLLLERARAQAQKATLAAELFRETALQAERLLQSVRQIEEYAIFHLTPDGRVSSWNAGVKHVLGFDEPEWVGRHFSTIFPPDEVPEAPDAELARALATGAANNDRWQVRKDGTRFFANGITTALRSGGGEVWGYIKVMRDRTALKRAEDAQREYAERMGNLVEGISDIFFALDREWRFTYCNRHLMRYVRPGVAPLGRDFWEAFPSLVGTVFEDHYRRAMGDRVPVHFEALGVMSGAWLEVHAYPTADGLAVIASDQTERRRAEREQRKFKFISDNASDASFLIDAAGRFRYVNNAAARHLGYTPEQLLMMAMWDVAPRYGPAEARAQLERAREGSLPPLESVHRRADGSTFPVEVTLDRMNIEGEELFFGIARDITERRRSEAARAELTQLLVTGQEAERLAIARDLHDQMGQYLAALAIGLKSIEALCKADASAAERMAKLHDLTREIGREVHRIGHRLRPTALDDLGLAAALGNYLEDWSQQSGIAAEFHGSGLDGRRLPAHVETAAYRIVQEALTNVLKHAGARRVSVVARRDGAQLNIVVEDDGVGFDAEAAMSAREGRMGLLGMRERIVLSGGSLDIESTPGGGTSVYARLPLPREGEAA